MSDTAAPAHPAILAALAEANTGSAPSYGADPFVQAARDKLCATFETDVEIWLVSSGTAANALALSVMCPPTGAVLCHAEAHIERDERGAPAFFTGGAKLSLLSGPHAKIDMVELKQRLDANRMDFVHETPAQVLSLSNLTENGAAYTSGETRERAELARAAGLSVHVDGARFANALLATGASPADLSWRAGVDVLSFGATKNGALGCEAVILFGEARGLAAELRTRAKRAGHMPPKMRYLGAQMLAYLDGDLWLDLARRANASAQRLSAALVAAGGELRHPVDGNEVFVALPDVVANKLSAAGAGFYPWGGGVYRFVCSWATDTGEIEALEATLTAG